MAQTVEHLAADPVPSAASEVARITYRYLRWLMIALPALLFFVTVATAIQQGHLETSISAYYGGPVRDVFVGVMVALAACMVAYQGDSLLEDYVLNGAGFYAVFVALVPNNLAETMQDLRRNRTPDGVTPGDYVWFLRTALGGVLALCALLLWIELRRLDRAGQLWRTGRRNQVLVVLTGLTLAAFLALAMWQLWTPPADEVTMPGLSGLGLPVRIHDLAAILLLAALALAVLTHAWPWLVAPERGLAGASDLRQVNWRYLGIFGLMVLGPVGALVAHRMGSDHEVIFLEWWEILWFAVFWVLETVRTGRPARAA